MNDVEALIGLSAIPGMGVRTIHQLLKKNPRSDSILNMDAAVLMETAGLSASMAKKIHQFQNHRFVETEIKKSKDAGAEIITWFDKRYPERLRDIYDPPVLLYARGDLSLLNKACIALVGTRRASAYGKSMAREMGQGISAQGIPVISGMASGIDTAAHKGALSESGKTIAVFGCGVDVVFPAFNQELYSAISKDGLILSEFPMGSEPLPHHFPRRNRIVSGMSEGTVVIEAGIKSGAMITAYLALEQGRDVFAVPGQIHAKGSKGPHKLIQEGARLTQHVDDILFELKAFSVSNASVKPPVEIDLSEKEKQIVSLLSHEPVHIDWIAEKTQLMVSEALSILLSLELKQIIRQLAGMMYVRR